MDFPFSSGRSETLHLSPTHLRHADPVHELRKLRRSMSRSPSKLNRHTRSPLASPPTQPQRSPLGMSLNPQETTTAVRQYASDDNAPSSAKKPKPALARSTPIKGFFRTARPETQSTPSVHRALIESSDFGNGSSSSQESSGGQENQTFTPSNSPPEPSQHESFMPKLQSVPFRTPGTRSRAAATFDGEFGHGTPAKSSPLKRNDGAMKLNSSTFGSPSAKRRSLYGVPFEIAHDLANINTPEDTKMAASDGDSSSDDHPFRSTLARGYAGSRRPNVQQRLAQKVGANRNRRSLEITYASPQPVRRTSNMSKGRTSLDSALPQQEPRYEANEMRSSYRDGVALMDNIRPQHARNTRQHPHPLSQALTPTSITPTLTDDPGTISMAAPSPMGAPKPFSKSLPIGALRPTPRSTTSTGPSDTSGTEGSFATPKFFNIAKPDPAAFRSTGLISKRHRNPDELPPPPPGHADMPDTPCKKASSGYYVSPSPNVAHSISKPTFGQPAFGTPSNPFNLHTHKPAPDSFSKSIALFQKDDPYDKSNRRVSFTSIDGDDMVRSPSQAKDVQGDSQSSADELPPTPTKHASSLFGGKTSSLRSSLFGRRASVGPNTFFSPASNETLSDRHQPRSKLSQSGTMSELNGSNAGKLGPSDLANLSLCPSSFKAPPSFARSRFQKRSTCKTPFPLSHKNLRTSGPKNAVFDCTKANTRSPVSQCTNGNSSGLPFTPADTGFPDPSVLSISPNSKMPISPSLRHGLGSSFIKPPETPTSHRDSGQTFASSLMMTPSHNAPVTHDIDQVLKYRFKKVEWYAKGEFSEVYKVYQPAERQSQSYFSPAHGLRPLQKQLPDQVFVVKKSKAPHSSYKLLEKKFREVSIMKALGKSDHTVFLIDSWEANHHLYLQTEYCEEGSLDTFLLRQGRDGRLDDFRIWKIMVELASVNCASNYARATVVD